MSGASTDLAKVNSESSDIKHCLITIHGTGDTSETDTGDKWWQHGSPCVQKLLNRVPAEHDLYLLPFKWDSANSQKNRVEAGKALARVMNELPKGTTVSVVAHSHGGNVLLYALSNIKNVRERLRAAVLVGTPPLGERSNWIAIAYFLFGIVALLSSFLISVLATAILSSNWVGERAPVQEAIGVVVFAILSLVGTGWLTANQRRFDKAALVIVVLLGSLVCIFILARRQLPDLENVGWSVLGPMMALVLVFLFASFLVGIAMLRHATSALWREYKKRRFVKNLSGRLHVLMHSKDEAFGLLQGVSQLELTLADPNQMSRAMASLFVKMLPLVIILSWWLGYHFNFDILWWGYPVLTFVLFAPAYLVTRTISVLVGTLLGTWTASNLNRRIATTVSTAALGADTQNRLDFDHKVWKSGLNIVSVPPEAEEEMLDRACKQASETACKMVRQGVPAMVGDSRFMERLVPLVTFKELMHCGYFENEVVLDEIARLLRQP
tara:strand:+ start:8938 stop:10425 length:1488 start_codon:yes stop_codon:yes gene_type:complete